MYDKNEFLQLLEYFLLNIIMKQRKVRIAPKIVTSLFLGWPLKIEKTRDVSVADITNVDITLKTLLNYVTNTGELIIWTNIETLIKLTKKNYGLLTIRAYFLDIYNPNTSSIFSKIIVVDAVQFCCQTLSFLSILLKALRKTFFFFFVVDIFLKEN